MKSLRDIFRELTGRPLSDKQLHRVEKAQQALGLRSSDAMMYMLLVLEMYVATLGDILAQIERSATTNKETMQDVADAAMERAATRTAPAMAQQVVDQVRVLSSATALEVRTKWIVAGVACTALVIGAAVAGGFYLGHRDAQAHGEKQFALGVKQALDTNAAAQWTATTQGKLAWQMYQDGTLTKLMHCSGPGWVEQNGNCYPFVLKNDGLYGWRMPRLD